MTDFISWVELGDELYYITDFEAFSERGRDLLRESKDNDLLGHGAIRDFYQLDNVGRNKQLLHFWDTHRLPQELAEKIDKFDMYWGKMFRSGYFMKDDLHLIIRFAPEKWKIKAARQLMKRPLSNADEVCIIRNVPSLISDLNL